MRKRIKELMLVFLGIFVISQAFVIIYTLKKLDKVEVALAKTDHPSTGTTQLKEELGSQTSPIPVEQDGAPTLGDSQASVKIVEFTDFECSFCKEVQPTIRDLLKKYDGKVQFTVRNYPLGSIHSGAVDAALAGYCAFDQNKFWEMHDAMFQKANNGGSLKKDVLTMISSEIGLDSITFSECFDSKKYIDRVQKDFEDGTSYGVNGTPTFFVNNRIVTGNQPLEVFSKVIDEELSKTKKK